MFPRSLFQVAALALAVLLGAASAGAACLVLDGGTALEVRSVPERRGALVTFRDANDRLTSMRAAEVDSAATDEANRRGICAGRSPAHASRASSLRDSPRPIEIDGPTGIGPHSPTASEIVAAMRERAAGKQVGPPRGFSIDCGVVECGKQHLEVAAPARNAAPSREEEAAESPQPRAAASSLGTSSARSLFGEGFHRSEPAEAPSPAPTARKKPRRG